MNPDQAFDLAEASRRISNLLRVGTIESVDLESARAVARLNDDLSTPELPWLVARAHEEIVWDAPAVGEQVIVLAPMGDLEQAVILGGIYSNGFPAPSSEASKTLRIHADGGKDEYDSVTRRRRITLPADGELVVSVGDTTLTLRSGVAEIDAAEVLLGPDGGRQPVARVGDKVMINSGSSAGLNGVIHEGSDAVSAS